VSVTRDRQAGKTWQTPPGVVIWDSCKVGVHIGRFEACSTFTGDYGLSARRVAKATRISRRHRGTSSGCLTDFAEIFDKQCRAHLSRRGLNNGVILPVLALRPLISKPLNELHRKQLRARLPATVVPRCFCDLM
jgi:hypothetical protein